MPNQTGLPPAHVMAGNFIIAQGTQQAQGLQGWWPMTGAGDRATNMVPFGSDANFNNTPSLVVDGERGQVYDLNGTNETFDVVYYELLSPEGTQWVSISAWVKIDDFNETFAIMSQQRVLASRHQYLFGFLTGTNKWAYLYHNSASTYHQWTMTAANPVSTDTWTHVAVTFNPGTGGSLKMWVNGVSYAGTWTSGSGNDEPGSSSRDVWIAGDESSGHEIPGRISDVRRYNRELTDDDVWQMWAPETRWDLYEDPGQTALSIPIAAGASTAWNRPAPPHVLQSYQAVIPNIRSQQAVGLQSWWPASALPGTLSLPDRGFDSHGTDLTLQGNLDYIQDDIMGHVLDFDGTDDYAFRAVDDWRSGDEIGTVAAWIKVTNFDSDYYVFSSSNKDDASLTDGLGFVIEASTGSPYVISEVTGTQNRVDSDSGLTAGSWHHVVWTSDGSAWSIYIDGVASALTVVAGSNNGTWLADISNRDNYTIGALYINSAFANDFTGQMSEVRYYDRYLSADEVWQQWSNETRWELYQPPLTAMSIPININVVGEVGSAIPSWILETIPRVNRRSIQAIDLVGWWPFGQFDRRDQIFEFGTGRNWTGAAQGAGDHFINDPIFGPVNDWNASDSHYANVGTTTLFEPDADFTASIWVKSSGGDFKGLFTKGDAQAGPLEMEWGISTGGDSALVGGTGDTDIIFFYPESTTSIADDYVVAQDILDGNWHLITCVFQASTYARIYVDGVLRASRTTGIPSAVATGTFVNVVIGSWDAPAGNSIVGQTGEVRFYDRALSADEVFQMWDPVTRWDLYEPPLQAASPPIPVGRISQIATEVLVTPNPNAVVTQLATEVLLQPSDPLGRISQAAVEVLITPNPNAIVSQLAAEVLIADDSPPAPSAGDSSSHQEHIIWVELVDWNLL